MNNTDTIKVSLFYCSQINTIVSDRAQAAFTTV